MACEWKVAEGKDGWYWACNKGCSGGPFRHKGQAAAAACEHGECS